VYCRSHHCHLVGYVPIAKSVPPSYYVSTSADNNDCNLASQATTNTYYSRERVYVPLHPCSNENNLQDPLHLGALTNQMDPDACPWTSINVGTISHLQRNTPQQYQTGWLQIYFKSFYDRWFLLPFYVGFPFFLFTFLCFNFLIVFPPFFCLVFYCPFFFTCFCLCFSAHMGLISSLLQLAWD
jgi:hypothetical protein